MALFAFVGLCVYLFIKKNPNNYKDLLTKYKATQIMITGKTLIGGWRTLKRQNYTGDNLKYTDDEYCDTTDDEYLSDINDDV